MANGILPAGNPFLLNGRLLSIQKPIFMAVYKKCNCEHVTVQSLVTGTLASSTNDTRKEWLAALIGSEGTALRASSCTGAGRATVASDEVTAWILLATSSRRPTVLIAVAVPIAVAASVGPVPALIQMMDMGSVALHVTVGELLCFNRIPVLARAKVWIPVMTGTKGFVNSRRSICVDEGCNAAEVEVGGKVAIITIGASEGIDLSLEQRDNVGIFRVRDGTQKDGGSGACIEVVILLSLQSEVQEKSVTEVEHVGIPMPCWG